MTQEEKAEAYSKAVEKAKQEYSITTSEDRKQWLEELFPELRESEDERIRKEILNYIDKATGCKRWIAWLEQQGKPVEINPTEFDSRLNKLLKQFETLPKEELISSLSFYLNVVQNNGTYKSDEKQDEQRSIWSEEDKHWMQKVIDFMNHPDLIKATPTLAKDTINWLKSLKDRVQPQSKQEWSEEDESNFQGIIDVIKENKHHATDYEHMTYYKLLSWFKSLKERYVWKPSDEQIDALEHFVRSIGESGFASPYDDNTRLLYSLLEQLKKL